LDCDLDLGDKARRWLHLFSANPETNSWARVLRLGINLHQTLIQADHPRYVEYLNKREIKGIDGSERFYASQIIEIIDPERTYLDPNFILTREQRKNQKLLVNLYYWAKSLSS
jgi:hypothetical protein